MTPPIIQSARRAATSETQTDTWFIGPRVQVCRLLRDHVGAEYAAWFNDPDVRRYIKFARTTPTIDDLMTYWAAMNGNNGVDFLGIFLSGGQHIGNIKFETGPLDDEMHAGFLIGSAAWRRKGVLSEVMAPCIHELRNRRPYLRRVYLTVDPTNTAGITAFSRLGFSSTGVIDRLGDLEMDFIAA